MRYDVKQLFNRSLLTNFLFNGIKIFAKTECVKFLFLMNKNTDDVKNRNE